MTPEADPQFGAGAGAGAVLPCARPHRIEVLRKRADFLRAARARRQGTPGFLLQARLRGADEPATGPRVGFTCSRKLGNAVTRNRAKRRLRAVARAVLPQAGRPGWDYVLVGRPETTVERPFAALVADLTTALEYVHAGKPNARKPNAGRAKGGRT